MATAKIMKFGIHIYFIFENRVSNESNSFLRVTIRPDRVTESFRKRRVFKYKYVGYSGAPAVQRGNPRSVDAGRSFFDVSFLFIILFVFNF